MGFMDKFKGTVQNVSDKTKVTVEKQKIKSSINKEKDSIRKSFESIGEKYYNMYKQRYDSKMLDEVIAIDVAYATIEELKEDLANCDGNITCPNCKKRIAKESKYCAYCGQEVLTEDKEEENKEDVLEDLTSINL